MSAEGQGCTKPRPQHVLSLFLGRGSTVAVSEQCKTPELCGGQFWGDCLVGYKCWYGQGVETVPAAFGAGGSSGVSALSITWVILVLLLWWSLQVSGAGRVVFALWGLNQMRGAQGQPKAGFKGQTGRGLLSELRVGGNRHLRCSLGLGIYLGSFWSPYPVCSARGVWGAEPKLKNPYFTIRWFLCLLLLQ